MQDIPEEIRENFDFREMWDDLYETAALRGYRDVVALMDEIERSNSPEELDEEEVLERGYF